jgi:hypothetical protein
MNLREMVSWSGLNSYGSVYWPMARSCEQCEEHVDCIKQRHILDYLTALFASQ